MRRPILAFVLTLVGLCFLPAPHSAAQQDASPPTIVVLKIQGTIEFARAGWANPQLLLAGTLIGPSDLIYPNHAALLVLCPDGSTHEFLPSELLPDTVVKCPVKASGYVVGDSGTKRLNIRRGGRQDPSIPYLIQPRATVVRSASVELRWNAVPNVQSYRVVVRGDAQPWQSGDLDPASIVQDGAARLDLPISLSEKTPYTVQICVRYRDTNQHCTTDPDWSTGDDLAFYYIPTPVLDMAEKQLIRELGPDMPESLYARAVLFSQPVYPLSQTESIGPYQDAIVLLERIKTAYPTSDLARSPGLYNALGELYRDISLPLSAAQNFKKAAELAQSGTEAAARAALGQAMTTPDGDAVVTFYNETLDQYARFLNNDAYDKQLAALCQQMGDIRIDIDRCN